MYYVHIKEKQKKCKQKNACAITVKVRVSAQHLLSAHIQYFKS